MSANLLLAQFSSKLFAIRRQSHVRGIVYWVLFFYQEVLYIKNLCSGAFAKMRKATLIASTSLSPSICPSAWNISAPTGRIFMKLRIWIFFPKIFGEIKFSLTFDKSNGYFTWRLVCFYDLLLLLYNFIARNFFSVHTPEYKNDLNCSFIQFTWVVTHPVRGIKGSG